MGDASRPRGRIDRTWHWCGICTIRARAAIAGPAEVPSLVCYGCWRLRSRHPLPAHKYAHAGYSSATGPASGLSELGRDRLGLPADESGKHPGVVPLSLPCAVGNRVPTDGHASCPSRSCWCVCVRVRASVCARTCVCACALACMRAC